MRIEKAVSTAEKLTIFPKSAIKIRTVVSQPDSSFNDLEQAVSTDPALSAQVLKIANSPYFGVSRKVGQLRQALVLIGYEATRDLALALALLSMSKRQGGAAANLWTHCLGTAVMARLLCDACEPDLAGEAFVAGLLHDIGKPIACLVQEDDAGQEWVPRSTVSSLEDERKRQGFDHAELGAACLEQWNLAESTCAAIRHHHCPTILEMDSEGGLLARVLSLANEGAHDHERGDDVWSALMSSVELESRISLEQVKAAAAEVPNAAHTFGID